MCTNEICFFIHKNQKIKAFIKISGWGDLCSYYFYVQLSFCFRADDIIGEAIEIRIIVQDGLREVVLSPLFRRYIAEECLI